MRCVVSAGELAAALSTIHPAVPTRATSPILTHVLLDARDGQLTISATNIEIALRTSIAASVLDAGRATTTESKLSGWTALQPGTADVTLVADAKGITATARRDRIRLGVADADDFPPLPDVNGQAFEVSAELLSAGLAATLPSVAQDEGRETLRGLSMVFGDGALELVGADGLRLAFASLDLGDPVETRTTLVVPRSSVMALRRILPDTGNVTVQTGERASQVAFRTGNTELFSRLIGDQYYDWRRVVPVEFRTSVTVKAADLTRQLKSAQLIGKTVPVRLLIEPETDSVAIHAAEGTDAHDGIIDAWVTGEGVNIALDCAHALTAIDALGSESVEFGFNLASQTMVLFDPEHKATGYQVLQPRHVDAQNQAIRSEAA